MVFLRDKIGTAHNINSPETFLSAKAIQRRLKQGLKVTEEDLPVSQSYINAIRELGVDVFYTSRWFNALLIQTEASKINAIEALTFVTEVEYVAPNERLIKNGRNKFEEEEMDVDLGVNSSKQLIQIGIGDMHEEGFRGEGIHIALLDGGYTGVDANQYFSLLRDQNRIKDVHDFVRNTDNPFQYSQHGTMVLSSMAAYRESIFVGAAYMAEYSLYVTEDAATEYRIEEYNWLLAAERADSAGVDIINSSLGYSWFDDPAMDYTPADMDGQTTVISKAARIASQKGMLVVTSAGNYGNNNWKIITAPADVAEVLAIGAVSETGLRATLSSTGPTADNRIKPDLMALGLGAAVINAAGNEVFVSGTSLSSPLVASLAAGLWQAYPQLSNAEIKEALIRSGSMFTNADILMGHGIPDFLKASQWIEDKFLKKAFSIYPNPSSGSELNIRSIADNNGELTVNILNSAGQQLARYTIDPSLNYGRYVLDVSGFSNGIYLIQIRSNSGRQTLRWIKQ